MAIGSAESPARTERRGERWRTAEETRGPPREEEEEEKEKEGGTAEKCGEKEKEEEDEQEGPLGIVRGRSLVTRDSCDPDDP